MFFRRLMPVLSFFFLLLSALHMGCNSHRGVVIKNRKLTPYWSEWVFLREYRGEISLPALYTTRSDRLQPFCASCSDSLSLGDPDIFVDKRVFNQLNIVGKNLKNQFASLLSVKLPRDKKYICGDIGEIVSTWHCIVYGLNYMYVNPDSVSFNFQSENCYLPDTSWFRTGRKIAVGAVYLDSLVFISEDNLPEYKRVLLEELVKIRGQESESGLLFRITKSSNGYYKITAYNVIYAIRTVSTYVQEQHFSFDTVDERRKYSFDNFSFNLSLSNKDSRIYYVHISPSPVRKNTYCGAFGKKRTFYVGSKSICTFYPRRFENGLRVDLTLSTLSIRPREQLGFVK